jgi:hypothetical protein
MRKRVIVAVLSHGILAMLVLSQNVLLLAAENPGEEPGNAASAAMPQATEMEEMKAQIEKQRKQIEELQAILTKQQQTLDKALGKLTSASAAAPVPEEQKVGDVELIKGELEAVAESSAQANQRLSKVESDTAAHAKSSDAKLRQLGNFTFSGDARVRYEPFFQEGAPDRHRERIRLRFNVNAKISDEFNGGFSIATGSLDDPVSTNQSFTQFFNRKNFNLDKAFITYRPKFAKPVKLDAGKFAYPWYRTSMTFDNDVNPEGFAQTLSFDMESSAFRNFTVVGFQLPINEVSGGPDSFVIGGQIQTHFGLGSKARLSLYGAGVNMLRMDPVGVASAGRVTGIFVGSLPNSNTLKRNANGAVTGYAYKFAYLDTILKLDLDTSTRFPTSIFFNFVNNVRGPRERSGYWAEATVGKQRQAKDWQFAYGFIRIEKDAVVSAFNESDIRSATNVLDHKLQAGYMFHGSVQGQFTAWIGKLANPQDNPELVPIGVRSACLGSDLSNCRDPYLKRMQFDVIFKF